MSEPGIPGGPVQVACCFDRHMELPFLVTASSIKRHLKCDRKVVVHAFHSDPLATEPGILFGLDSDNFEVRFQRIESPFRKVEVTSRLTEATLLRLMLPSLLPAIDRVVYLDCDIVVLNDIAALYDTDLVGQALAACLDYSLIGIHVENNWRFVVGPVVWDPASYVTEVVGLTDWRTYFNAGILVFDLAKWREANLAAAAISYLERTAGRRLLNDQDAINNVVDGAFVRLDPRWNVNACRTEPEFLTAGRTLQEIGELLRRDPWIMHYAGPDKPWDGDSAKTEWDHIFWEEAVESAALPLLLQGYLESCHKRGLTKLASAADLISLGKPSLSREASQMFAKKFPSETADALASGQFAADFERENDAKGGSTITVAISEFTHRGGVRDGELLRFNLGGVNRCFVYGPYTWYPAGTYEATFEFATKSWAIGRKTALVIEIVDHSGRYLAQRQLARRLDLTVGNCTLPFVIDGNELHVEFRISARCFWAGQLWFKGLKLRRLEGAARV